MNPKVFIVILNWNNPNDTVECLQSLKRINYDNLEIIVIDNGSTDNSVGIIKQGFIEITLIENKENAGFAEGNNIGIKYALDNKADYIFILNNDTTVDKDVLLHLIKNAETIENAGILAPKTYYYDKPDIINSCGTDINWFKLRPNLGNCGKKDNGQFKQITEQDIFPGAALFIKREVIEKVGMFDPDLFVIHEDTDLCLRMKESGYKNFLVPEAIIYHKTQRSISKYSFLISYYSTRNLLYVAGKHASLINKFLVYLGVSLLALKNIYQIIFYGYGIGKYKPLTLILSPKGRGKGEGESYPAEAEFSCHNTKKETAKGFFIGFKDFIFNNMGKYH